MELCLSSRLQVSAGSWINTLNIEEASRENLEAAFQESMICLEAALGMLSPFYSEEMLQKLKESYLNAIQKKLENANSDIQ